MGIVLILFLSANDGMGNMGGSVLSSVLLSSYDAGFLVAFSLASIPYAAAFTDDLEYNYAKYLVVRGSLGKYVFSKMLVIFISSMLTMGIGITCFSMLCSLGLPWVDEGMAEYISMFGGYRSFLDHGQYLLWFWFYGMQWGIFALQHACKAKEQPCRCPQQECPCEHFPIAVPNIMPCVKDHARVKRCYFPKAVCAEFDQYLVKQNRYGKYQQFIRPEK